jgi:hypothetical protein
MMPFSGVHQYCRAVNPRQTACIVHTEQTGSYQTAVILSTTLCIRTVVALKVSRIVAWTFSIDDGTLTGL